MMKYWMSIIATLMLVSACSDVPPHAYADRGAPESLLSKSQERVNVSLVNESGIAELQQWLERHQPTNAVLSCAPSSLRCAQARDLLEQYGVDLRMVVSRTGQDVAHLNYTHVVARDCENSYIDNPRNPYHVHAPAFGCSLAANMVQQISDRKQLTDPDMVPMQDGRRAAQVARGATQPNNYTPPSVTTEFESLSVGGSGSN